MLLFKVETTEFGLKVLKVSYFDSSLKESIEVDCLELFKNNLDNNLFAVINEYVHTLPLYTQKEIFETFSKIYINNYSSNYNDINIVNKIENKIVKVTELLNYENFKMFIKSKEKFIQIPDNIEKEFVYDQNLNVIREKTYVYDEYIGLITLILFIRALCPLYTDYFNYIRQVTPYFYFKLLSLFSKSELYESPEMYKLKEYIEFNQETLNDSSKNDFTIINTSLSSDDIIDNLVAEVIFNKLIMIDFFTKKCNIISFIFQTIKYKGNFNTESLSIRAKASINDTTKEDISYFEDYRKNTEVALGTIIEIQNALSNINYILNNFKNAKFNNELYQQEINNFNLYNNLKINKIQIYLLGTLIGKSINPRSLFYLEYKTIIDLFIFAKVLLHSNNLDIISALFSAEKTIEYNMLSISIKNSLNKNSFNNLLPYFKHSVNEQNNILENTITEFEHNITQNLWKVINPLDSYRSFLTEDNYIVFPGNFNQYLIKFVEFIYST